VLAWPTAQTSLPASAETEYSWFTPLKAELDTTLQLEPSQCSTRALLCPSFPTAQTSFDEVAVTAYRLSAGGLSILVQLLPSQCSINDPPAFCLPTAHTSLLATAATPRSWLTFPGETVGTTCQLLPSKCSASVRIVPP